MLSCVVFVDDLWKEWHFWMVLWQDLNRFVGKSFPDKYARTKLYTIWWWADMHTLGNSIAIHLLMQTCPEWNNIDNNRKQRIDFSYRNREQSGVLAFANCKCILSFCENMSHNSPFRHAPSNKRFLIIYACEIQANEIHMKMIHWKVSTISFWIYINFIILGGGWLLWMEVLTYLFVYLMYPTYFGLAMKCHWW